ncbi:MAG: ribosomal protein S19 family protein, partial [Methanolinea sp.]
MAKKAQKKIPRRREEFTYRGFRLDELRAMGRSELAAVMPARARRKLLRGLTRGEEHLLAQFKKGDGTIRTHLRDMIVMPEMVGRTVDIHNGKEFVKVEIL